MSARTIFDNEIEDILEATNQLFSPQDGKGDDRQMYQRIFYTLEEVKKRKNDGVYELC